ncbi:MAG: hypothetical protein WC827_02595 [Candidatus Paceibacterota bacterium]|jgi:hypothetical protein
MKITIKIKEVVKDIDFYLCRKYQNFEKKTRDELIMLGFKILGSLAVIDLLLFGISLRYMNGWVSLLQVIFFTITVCFWMCFVGMVSVD